MCRIARPYGYVVRIDADARRDIGCGIWYRRMSHPDAGVRAESARAVLGTQPSNAVRLDAPMKTHR